MDDWWDDNGSGDDNDDEYHQFEDKPKLSSLKVEYHHLIGRSHHPIQLESQAWTNTIFNLLTNMAAHR